MSTLKLIHDTYGYEKRLNFFKVNLEEINPKNILDIGCGTGDLLTIPLSSHFTKIKVYGFDSDKYSIDIASQNNILSNLSFLNDLKIVEDSKFNVVIASEVIEHVEDPYQFLLNLRTYIDNTSKSKIFITLPNGFGPYEFNTLIENILYTLKINFLIKSIKSLFISNAINNLQKDTLANSPHLNFFSFNEISKLFHDAGLEIIKYEPRTFLCGPYFSRIIELFKLTKWNETIVRSLPKQMASGWMFILQIKSDPTNSTWKRSGWSTMRKNFNLKRANLSHLI
jgi:ubiquinone/menaquinone biosynthesis C-methylase UbiE